MKKILKSIICIALAAFLLLPLTACGGNRNGSTVQFWVYGSQEELSMYRALVDAFNAGYGAEHGITVNISIKPNNSYKGTFEISGNSSSGADIGLVIDDNFKGWVYKNYIANIQEYVDANSELYNAASFFDSVTNRYRLDTTTNTSNPDDPLYGIPFDTQPTALYYNESYFKNAGIVVISVDEEDLDAWNAGGVADKLGNTKEDLGLTVDVPAKGYFRSKYPYISGGAAWEKPAAGEILVFNNRIAMNWDEIEDLSMLFTRFYNSDSPCEYGYFTEWWFNYGWSVGGDCLTDLTGEGTWNYSLLDENPNYIVKEGCTYTGILSGKEYQAGDSISFYDKMAVTASDEVTPTSTGGYTINGTEVPVRDEVIAEAAKADGVLTQMPSTREAFLRYLRLGSKTTADVDGMGGLEVSPNPLAFSVKSRVNWFCIGDLAMLVESSAYLMDVAAVMEDEWNIAPVAIYKEYTDPSDPYCDEVKVQGVSAGHSQAKTAVITQSSTKKDEAVQFLLWCAGEEGQNIRTSSGYFPVSDQYVENISFRDSVNAPQNYMCFADAIKYEGPGDWWYMPDYLWIEEWAPILNSEVRNGKKTFDQWYQTAITDTNELLKDYEQFQTAQ